MTRSATQNAVPTPTFERCDDIGRLVAVTWDGPGAGAAGDTAGGRRRLTLTIRESKFGRHQQAAALARNDMEPMTPVAARVQTITAPEGRSNTADSANPSA